MSPPEKLSGCKVLRNVTLISLSCPRRTGGCPSRFFSPIAENMINLPYVTCVPDDHAWGFNMAMEAEDAGRAQGLLEEILKNTPLLHPGNTILSIFPHKRNPEITGALFEAFGQEDVQINALASSPSTISIVLDDKVLNRASKALFGPFSFSGYQSLAEWKQAQEGKEQLYKEVVASFQEQRPKVYGLEYQDNQELIRVEMDTRRIGEFGMAFKEFARLGLNLSFLATGPCGKKESKKVGFCLPLIPEGSHERLLGALSPGPDTENTAPVATFAMNGPHFGDRYGIVSELLGSLEKARIDLLGLSCTIASITGVVPSASIGATIEAIKGCFDIPSVVERA
ncbi:MAG: hypothetical protein JRF51_08900 [Deltaproteobacteria bacterium]|nr:hypothetical protein [Deltaproteobacteria bacterium]